MRLTINEDFIQVWDDVFGDRTEEICNKSIDVFNYAESMGLTYSRQQTERIPSVAKKDDTYFPIDDLDAEAQVTNSDLFTQVKQLMQRATAEYLEQYSSLSNAQFHFNNFRHQRTKVGGGYHAWHFERGEAENIYRTLTFILYMNDVHEGGETEFLYYPKRIQPKAGRLLVFPTTFTHTHRGNPPLSNTKYIITTWACVI